MPRKDRPQLVHDRVKELQKLIARDCTAAQSARSRAGMLLDMEGLQAYMHEAFLTFSGKLDSAFDFVTASLLMSRLSSDFSGNFLKLLHGVVDLWKDNGNVTVFQLLNEVTCLLASCIKLDTVRNGVQGRSNYACPHNSCGGLRVSAS